MAVAGWSVLQITIAIVTILVTSFILFAFWRLTYWKRQGIPYLSPKLPFGNVNDVFLGKRPFGNVMHDIYRQLSGKPYAGIYMALQPSLLVMDPKLIKDILIRTAITNFQHHIANPHPTKDPYIANNIFFARGPRWKTLRAGLSPAFSSGKMKMMYPLVVAKAKKLASVLEEIAQGSDPKIDAKFHAARYTTDVIASCAFGIETNSLEDPGNEFFNMGLKVFERTFRHTLDTMIIFQFSSLVRIAGSVFITKDVADFFRHLVWGVVKEREEKNIQRGDYMDMLIQLKNNGKVYETGDDKKTAVAQDVDKMKISEHFGGDSLVAHALVFYTAGYETSSTALNFALLELARNPDCQEKLINEIDETLRKNNGEIDYDALRSMVYLDKVVNETLRKYPTLAVLDRYCTEEYRNPEYNLVIPKGMSVLVPVLGIHYDTKYYHDPYRFDPERFGEDTKDNRPSCTFMPFGEGPRICIGMRFAQMQIKAGLINILSKMRFSVPDKLKEMRELPFEINSFLVAPDEGLLLTVHKRETSTVL
ncbi:cytochrome P450 6k1-like isoform X1 [Ischnura elegans]|uniref:cytochrome P450 6k1-like isoform X1 n=1 Tax=Ischnura elegans TaxID=197161 RepID=UPI001ED8B78F|nr:cytochrome P450 6k1-like isoform X1 [Ischnura elegans]